MNRYQRFALILGVVMVFTLAKQDSFVSAQDNRDTLRGLQGFPVVVARLGAEIEKDGLTKEQLQTDTEQRLRMAGIKVFSLEEATQEKGSPYFYLHVHVDKLKSGCYSFNISTELIKEAFPLWETTWTQLELMGLSCNLSDIRQQAQDMVDEFINEYLAANENQTTKTSPRVTLTPTSHTLLAFARMPRAEARGGMATGDRAVARRAKAGWTFGELKSSRFGAVPLGFTTDAPRGSAGSFTP